MRRLGAESRWLRLAVALGLLGIAVLSALLSPDFRMPFPKLPCAFHEISGLPCLFCGGTRAVCAIMEGNPRAALYLNAMAFPVLALAGSGVCVLLVEAAVGRGLGPWEKIFRGMNRLAPVLIIAALAWWAVHVYFALKAPKPELVDLRNPIASKVRQFVCPSERSDLQ